MIERSPAAGKPGRIRRIASSVISLYPMLLSLQLAITSCDSSEHFITDIQYRKKVREQFEKQYALAGHRSDTLFSIFNDDLKTEEFEAMQFLYAYMPLCDLADYDGRFFLQNVRSSLAVRDTFSWGRNIPEEIFRHFVLPVRVNNENLDSSRWIFFHELKGRIRNKTMKEAALEVNHWCHEKVSYRGTDGRTSSPLATVKTAYGRCGEESTLTTAAMRSVGIPARQCYTPRWAHTDDNHAWVEVWIDGKWHYLGACEPEPDLDIAWFSTPAKQAMLVNTNVFGDYTGTEDILLDEELFTRINLLPNYTQTKRIIAKVTNVQQQPVSGADVEFQLYNYAEFYPLFKTKTDKNGIASFLTGYGDLMVWGTHLDKFGFAKIDVRLQDTAFIYLELTRELNGGLNLDFIPPVRQESIIMISDTLRKANDERLKFEDEQRKAYESAFIDSVSAYRLAETLHTDAFDFWKVLRQSRGNWREIINFVSEIPDSLKRWTYPLLDVVSEKDLRDVNPEVLLDAITNSATKSENSGNPNSVVPGSLDLIVRYVMNPRVDNECLKPFHAYLARKFEDRFIEEARKKPAALAGWITANLKMDENANYSRTPLTPRGVSDLKVADPHSRDIFFVALCRSFGIPARLDPATKIPQYHANGIWNDIYFEKQPVESSRNASLVLENYKENPVVPQYSVHYTIEQNRDGFYRSLDYENSPEISGFPATLRLIPGSYLLVTGNRQNDGTVLSRLVFVNLKAETESPVLIFLRKELTPPPVYGSFVIADLQQELLAGGLTPKMEKGLIMAWLEPGKEPTSHFIADLSAKAIQLNEWNVPVLLLFPTDQEADQFSAGEGKNLPPNILSEVYKTLSFERLKQSLDMPLSGALPVVLYMNSEGIINYFSEGYRIGIGEELARAVNR